MISSIPTRCKECRVKFTPEEKAKAQRIHSECIGAFVNRMAAKKEAERKKKERAALKLQKALDRQQKEKHKTWAKFHAEAQTPVNAFIRLRDAGLPCVSCGTPWQPDFQAGHYRSRGAAKHLALDVRNIHGQCIQCNLHKHSNAVEYRIRLVERAGLAMVEAIECDNEPRNYSIDDLKAIRKQFEDLTKQLKKEAA